MSAIRPSSKTLQASPLSSSADAPSAYTSTESLAGPSTVDIYGKPSRSQTSLWQPVKLQDERGSFIVHPRPTKRLWLEPWEQSHCLMGLASAVGTLLIARGLWNASQVQIKSLGETSTQSIGPQWLSVLQTGAGVAMVAAALTYVLMLPERKQGPNHDETDPRLLPRYDFHCDWLDTTPVPWEAMRAAHREPAAVPKNILQAWFGDKAALAGRDGPWREHAKIFGYTYHLITEDNMQTLIDTGDIELSENNQKILSYEFKHQNWWAVSDLVRYGWLVKHGGIYADLDMNPPSRDGHAIDLMEVVRPNGLTLITEEFGRDVGVRNGAYVFNGFLSAPANDPTLEHFCKILPRNWASANAHARSEYTHGGIRDAFAAFSTGPFSLNRVLNGCYQIVPFRLAAEVGIVNSQINHRSYGLRLWTENHIPKK